MKIIITSFALLYATSIASAHQGGLQAACDPTGLVSDYCKSGYYCEPVIGGDPNGQCIPGGGLQAACDPAYLGAGCQSGFYCEPVIGSPDQQGQCIPGGGLQASCEPDTGFGCQSGYYCEPVIGSPDQQGQCIPNDADDSDDDSYYDDVLVLYDSNDGSDEANEAVQFVKYLRTNRK